MKGRTMLRGALGAALTYGGLRVLLACVSDTGTTDPADADANETRDSAVGDGSRDVAVDASTTSDGGVRNFRYVFVSSTEHVGKFEPVDGGSATNGLSGADAFCTELAEASTFPHLRGLKWAAWLSLKGQHEAWRRLPLAAQGSRALAFSYRLHDGTEVFPAGFMFEATNDDAGVLRGPVPKNSIVLDERTNGARTNLVVWTGTAYDMSTHPANCEDWNAAPLGSGPWGLAGSTSNPVTFSHSGDIGAPPCSDSHHVYCFEIP